MRPKRTRHPNYPWAAWIKRGSVRLRSGRDYSCSERSIKQQARNAGVRHGVGVSIRPWLGGVVVRFVKEER